MKNEKLPKYKKLFIPILIEQLFHLLLANIDVIMLSQYSDFSVASVGLANQYIIIAMMSFGFINIALTILLNQLSVKQDWEIINSYISQAIYLNILLVVILSIALIVFPDILLDFLNTPDVSRDESIEYLRISGYGMFIHASVLVSASILRSFTYVKTVMNVMIMINIINITLNYIVLFSDLHLFGGGVAGVSHATNVSKFIGGALLVLVLIKQIPIRLQFVKWSNLKNILKLGIPSAGEHISFNVSQLFMTKFIAHIGFIAITSKIYVQTITSLVFVISLSVSQALQIIVGKMIGMSLRDEAILKTKNVLRNASVFSLILSILIYLLGQQIIHYFTDNVEIIELVVSLLFLTIFLEPLRCANVILVSTLNAFGVVRFPVVLNIIVSWIIVVPLTYLLVVIFNFDIYVVWIIFIGDELIRFIFMYRVLNQKSVIEKRIL